MKITALIYLFFISNSIAHAQDDKFSALEKYDIPSTHTYNDLHLKSGNITLIEFTQNAESIKIKFKVSRKSGYIYLNTTCARPGWFSCERWEDIRYYIKSNNKIIPLTRVQDFVYQDSTEHLTMLRANNESQDRIPLKYLTSDTFTLYFKHSGHRIKKFSLIEGDSGNWNYYDVKLPSSSKEEIDFDNNAYNMLSKYKKEDFKELSNDELFEKINKYILYNKIKQFFQELALSRGVKSNDIFILVNIVRLNPNINILNKSHEKIYEIISNENKISGYQWFISNYPRAKESRKALQNIYELAYNDAQSIDTLESYNDFIIAYPYADQKVEEAQDKAYKLEEKVYSGWFSSDEKNSRALLVKSKQLERKMKDADTEARDGYRLVIDRMNKLLQDKYPAEEATLRYLESEEFKDFYRDLKKSLASIQDTLKRIDSNTSDLSSTLKNQNQIMDSHFREAAQSREMAAKYTEQHRLWERYLKDKAI